MAALTALAVGSLALGAAGLGTQLYGATKAASAAKQQALVAQQQAQESADFTRQEEAINQQSAAFQAAASTASKGFNQGILQGQQDIEQQRYNAMILAANRQQLEIVRQGQRARAMALTTATAQGAAKQGASALGGGYGQISGQTNQNLLGVTQNLGIGANIFALNAGITQQKIGLNELQDTLAQQQADLTTQKSRLIQQYAGVNADLQTRYSQYGSQISSAQGISAIGGGMVGASSALFSAGTNFDKIFGTPSPNTPLDITYQTQGLPILPSGIPAAWGPGTLTGRY